MVLLSDIAIQFIALELVPRIVNKTLDLLEKGFSREDIAKEVCSSEFGQSTKTSVKRSTSTKAAPVHKHVTIDEYMSDYKDSQVCLFIITRGEDSGKICCRPANPSTFNKDDRKTQRCLKHENSSPGPDIETLLNKSKTTSSKADRVAGVRKAFPKGAPEVLNLSSETKPASISVSSCVMSGLGKISIKDQLVKDALKIDTKTPSRDDTPEKKPVLSRESASKDRTVRSHSPVSSCLQTPTREKSRTSTPECSERDSSPDKENEIPLDENGEEYFLEPSHPSAEDYLWMLYSKNQVLIFSKEFDACYGVYNSDDTINPSKSFKISSAWKKLLKPLSKTQETFVTERGIDIKEIDSK